MNDQEIVGLHRITKKHLLELCNKHKLFQTPHLNDQLYLHFQGFRSIENLEEYVGLKCLWLESNAISEIQGLECQTELKCLFLQNNLIKKIENLHCCKLLDTLNLASNHITKIENCGIEVLPELSSLNLSRNYIRKSEGLRELLNCKNISSLDLSHNRIEDILVVKIFANMPQLKVLVLQGNPVVSQVPQYRKTMILECKNLTYLDSRPVFPRDRACAEAWKRGGYEEERKENARWNRMDRKKIRDSVNATLRLRQNRGGGDAQLLESTDDEEDNCHPKKLRQIKEEEASVDLEISGVVHKPSQSLAETSNSSSSTPPNESTISTLSPSAPLINENKETHKSLDDAECVQSPNKLGREQNDKEFTPSAADKTLKNSVPSASEYQSKKSNLENKQENECKNIVDITELQEFSYTTSELQYESKEDPINEEGLISDTFGSDAIPEKAKDQFEEHRNHEFGSIEGEFGKEAKTMSKRTLGNRELTNYNENKTTVKIEEDLGCQNEIKELFEESIQISDDYVLPSELNSSLIESTLAWSAQKLAQEKSTICAPYCSSRFTSTNNLSDCNLDSHIEIGEQNSANIQIQFLKEEDNKMCLLEENDKIIRHSKSIFGQDEEYLETDFDRLKKSSILEAFASDTSHGSNEYGFESNSTDSNEELDDIFEGISELFSPKEVYKEDIKEHHHGDSTSGQPVDFSPGPDPHTKHVGLEHFIEYTDEEISDLSRRPSSVRIVDDYDGDDEYDKAMHFESDLKDEAKETVEDSNFSFSLNHDKSISSYPSTDASSNLYNETLPTNFQILLENQNTCSKISYQPNTYPETQAEKTDVPISGNTSVSTHEERDLSVRSCEDQIKTMEIFDITRSPNCPLQPEQSNNILSDQNVPKNDGFNSEDTIASSWLENFLNRSSEEPMSSTEYLVESLDNGNNLNENSSNFAFEYDSSEDTVASKWLENYLAGDIYLKEDETSLKNFIIQEDKEEEARFPKELNLEEEIEEALKDTLKAPKAFDSSKDSHEHSYSCQQAKENNDSHQSLEAIIKYSEATRELDIADTSKQANFKVYKKFLKEKVTELKTCEEPKYSNEFTYEQAAEKDCEELRLGTKSETQSLKRETSENLLSKSEATSEEISTALGKKTELCTDKVEDFGTKTQDVNLESLSWWEKTLAAARSKTLKEAQSKNNTEDCEDKEENGFFNQAKESTPALQDNILEKIRDTDIEEREEQLLSSNQAFKQNFEEYENYQDSKSEDVYSMIVRKMFEASQRVKSKSEEFLKLEQDDSFSDSSESPDSSSSESFQDDLTACSTLREVVKTFNQVTEKVSQQKQEKSKLIKELIANPLTKTFSAQTSDNINHQVEELKQEQRDRLSQLVDCVYAQRDKYDDTLEVVNGRLMVVKRSTGALEELPPPPPSKPSGSTKYISCGVTATQTSCNYDDSDFDDYGTALSEDNEDDEDEDEDDIEQHASDTKIKKILYSSPLSDVNCANESLPLSSSGSSTSIAREEDKNDHNLEIDSQQGAARKLYNEIDANAETDVLPEFTQWLEKDAGETAADYMPTLEKKKGKEEILLMQKFSEVVGGGEQRNELQVELDNSTDSFTDYGDAAAVLEDIALIFESPEGVE